MSEKEAVDERHAGGESVCNALLDRAPRNNAERKTDVYARLRRAYERNTGMYLTGDDVFDLVQRNDAIMQSVMEEAV